MSQVSGYVDLMEWLRIIYAPFLLKANSGIPSVDEIFNKQ